MAAWDLVDLERRGFGPRRSLAGLTLAELPTTAAVYAVVRPDLSAPNFYEQSPAGWFKGKDPTVGLGVLRLNWIHDAAVAYLGKANNLRARITLLRRFSKGEPVGHWGGRLLWQADVAYALTWMATPGAAPRASEKSFLEDFVHHFGALPFANLRG